MQKIKYYDSKMYKTETKIKTAFIILITFLIGLYIGLAINYLELQNKNEEIRKNKIEIENLKEIIYTEKLKNGRWFNRYDCR